MRKPKRVSFSFNEDYSGIVDGYEDFLPVQLEQEGVEKFTRRRVKHLIADHNDSKGNQYYTAWRYGDKEWLAALEYVMQWVEDRREYEEVVVGPNPLGEHIPWTSWSFYKEVYSLRGAKKWELVVHLDAVNDDRVTIIVEKNARYKEVQINEEQYIYDEDCEGMNRHYE